jgi:hypothetical protein
MGDGECVEEKERHKGVRGEGRREKGEGRRDGWGR